MLATSGREIGRRRLRIGTVLVGLTVTTWFNGVARSLGSRATARALLAVPAAVLVSWLIFGTVALSRQLTLTPRVAQGLAEPLVAVLVALPAIASLFIAIYSVGRTSVNDMIAVLQVSRADRISTTRWLSAVLGTVVGVVWTGPLVAQFLMSLPLLTAVAAAVACVLVAVGGAVLAQVLFSLLETAVIWTVPAGERLAGAVAGAGAALLVAWCALLALPVGGRIEAEGPLTVVAVPLVWIAEETVPSVLAIGLLAVGVVAAGWLVGVVDGLPRNSRPAARRWRVPTGTARTLVGLELRQWIRFPMNATFLLFSGLLVAVSVVVAGPTTSAGGWSGPAYAFFALVSTIGVGSFGPTRPSHWAFSVAGRPLGWVAPKLGSVLLLWAMATIVLVLVFSQFTAWRPSDLPGLLPTLLLELVAGCVVGLLLPVGREQSLSGAMSEAVAIIVVVSIALGFQSLPGVDTPVGYVVAHAVGILGLVGAYVLLARSSVGAPDGSAT